MLSGLLSIRGRLALALLYALYGAVAINAQSADYVDPPEDSKWFSVGFRVRALPLRPYSTLRNMQYLTSDKASGFGFRYDTRSESPAFGVGPAVEFAFSPRVNLSAEVLFSRIRYEVNGEVYRPTGERLKRTTEKTKGNLWDVPVLAHFSLKSEGALSKVYVAAGPTLRIISGVSTENTSELDNGARTSDQITASPTRRNLLGATVGIGLRLLDDFDNRVTPEFRYTRWGGRTFGTNSTQSPLNQLEIGVGITF